MRPQQLVGAADAKCPKCEYPAKPRMEHSIEAGTPLAKESLATLGVPTYDIVRVANGQEEHVFLLAEDRKDFPSALAGSKLASGDLRGDGPS